MLRNQYNDNYYDNGYNNYDDGYEYEYEYYDDYDDGYNTPRYGRTLNIKRLLLVVVAVLFLFGGVGTGVYFYMNRDQSMVTVCESETDYNKGIGLTFHVGKDGKTIKKIEKNDTVSLDFIKNNLNAENTEEIFAEYKKSMEESYNQTVEKYKDLSWFSSSIDSTDTYIKTTYTFAVGSKDFNYKDAEAIMKEFTLDYYYNTDEKKFIYDEAKFLDESTPLGSIENVKCNKQEVTVKKEK